MSTIRITKEFSFDMAHALANYEGKCSHVHGHTYSLSVTISGKVSSDVSAKPGMVMDFSDLKEVVQNEIIKPFDHSLLIWKEDHRFEPLSQFPRVHLTPYQPTCENLLMDFVTRLRRGLRATLLHSVMLRETPTSYATWCVDDNG